MELVCRINCVFFLRFRLEAEGHSLLGQFLIVSCQNTKCTVHLHNSDKIELCDQGILFCIDWLWQKKVKVKVKTSIYIARFILLRNVSCFTC